MRLAALQGWLRFGGAEMAACRSLVDKPARRADLYGVVELTLVLEDLGIRRGSEDT